MFGKSGSAPGRVSQTARRGVAVWVGVVAGLVIAYAGVLPAAHGVVGNPAFLLGLLVCIVAAAGGLGPTGTLVVILCVALIDRQFAQTLPITEETSEAAAVISLLVKVVFACGLGWALASRRRVRALNDELRREIAQRELSERSLRRSEATQRAVVDSLGEGVGLFDADDRMVYANQAFIERLDTLRDALEAQPFSDVVREDWRTPALVTLGERHAYEVALPDSERRLLVSETRFDSNPATPAMTLRVVRDLTEREREERRRHDLELELQRSQALQSLSVMAGGVAHDFNNLLCGVIGNAQLALRKLPKDAPPALGRCLTEIKAFADEAAQLSKQMLAYAGRRSLALGALEINAELTSALRLLQATIDSKAHLVLDFGEHLPLVGADRFQLRQVVTNLVLNALDAMGGIRGTLTLRTETIDVTALEQERLGVNPGAYVRVTVTDTGGGIPLDARQRLFEPFFSTKGPGRGMGLAAAAGIVRAHGGWLGVQETSASGTTFALLLPISHGTTLPKPVLSTAPRRESVARNILLIDDELAVRLVTSRILQELGHRVATAETGKQGVALLRQDPDAFDLIILDLTMPEQSGEETLVQIRSVAQGLPIVITSGFHVEDASMLLQLPAVVGFLEKPHTLTNLETLLNGVPGRSSSLPPALDAALPLADTLHQRRSSLSN
jgi:C4-dicarboxylate-specific signal transduction histidine kinase/CheY-like chemotaxis protein